MLASKLGDRTSSYFHRSAGSIYAITGGPDQKPIRKATLKEMQQMLAANYFAEGSMKPKIEAAIDFLSAGGTDGDHYRSGTYN